MALTSPLKPLPQQPHVPLVVLDQGSGMVSVPRPWVEYFQSLDGLLRGSIVSAVSDAAASAAGVPIGGLYQNAGAVRMRLV